MSLNPRAGKPVTADELTHIPKLITAYFTEQPNAERSVEKIAFGTSGHRGVSLEKSFRTSTFSITLIVCEPKRIQ